ncbi:MAG: DUF1501 domain-containing protein [Acidimicrobiia bacterium]
MSRVDPTTEEAVGALSAPAPQDVWSLDRRRFLQAAAAGVGISMMPAWLDGVAGAATPLRADQGVLVLVTMDGGADPLDMVVPISNGTYYQRRGGIAVGAAQALHVNPHRGLHPNLRHLRARWDLGEVAVVDGVGNPKADLSHFSAMADVQHGGPSNGVPRTGWLGRYLDGIGADPMHGVAIGSRVPLVLTGAKTSGTALPQQVEFVREGRDGNRALDAALVAMGAGSSGLGGLGDRIADSTATMMATSSTVRPLYGTGSGTTFAHQMRLAANLVNADLGIRCITIRHAGYDSHARQPEMLGERMAELDAGLAAFHSTLSGAFADRALVLCLSEFGRRVGANGSRGTDHGAGQSVLAVGKGVRAGFHGGLPSLTDLTREGNLTHWIDYRHVLSTVLSRWLGADPMQVLGTTGDIGFLRNPGGGVAFRPEHGDVLRLYRAFFNREPDAGGAQYWIDVFDRGASLDVIAESFTQSPEFRNTYSGTSNAEYVSRVYRNVLGRSYDEAGFRYWLGLLDSRRLTRGTLVRWVAANAEFVNRYPYAAIPR